MKTKKKYDITKRNVTPPVRKGFACDCYAPREMRLSNLMEQTPVTEFFLRENQPPHSKYKSVRCSTDVYMLFNQQRLDRMTLQRFSEYLNANIPTESPLSQLRSKCTDAQLMQFCKSRYLQSPSELMAWSKYIDYEAQRLSDDVAAALKSLAPAPTEPQPTDPQPTE